MFKKFLASVAILSVFMTSTAHAVIIDGVDHGSGSGTTVTYYKDAKLDASSFDASKGEELALQVELLQEGEVFWRVATPDYVPVKEVVDTRNDAGALSAKRYEYKWDGKDSTGAVVANGDYLVLLSVFDKTHQNVGSHTFNVKVGDSKTTNPPVDPGNGNGGGTSTDTPKVSALAVSKSSFKALSGESVKTTFSVYKDAYVTVVVKDKDGKTVKTFNEYNGNDYYYKGANHSVSWNGNSDSGSIVATGTYTLEVVAKTTDGKEIKETVTVDVTEATPANKGAIEDFTLDPSSTWDPTEENLEIEFELTADVNSLFVEAVSSNGKKHVELIDDDYADEDEYQEDWDGTDDDGDYIKPGVWEIIVRADGDKVSKFITVEYENPEITESFVTKKGFDPSEDEYIDLVFKLESDAVVTVEVLKGTKREATLWDEVSADDNKWYTVSWDGKDEDGDDVKEGSDWKFRIVAENEVDDDVNDVSVVGFKVEEDEASSKEVKITNNNVTPVVVDKNFNDPVTFSYCLEGYADVFLAVYDGKTASGKAEVELLDYVYQDSGCHKVDWNGLDDDNRKVSKGFYSYKLISKNGSHKYTKTGTFVVGSGEKKYILPEPPVNPEPPVEVSECAYYYSDTYNLGTSYPEMCDAIVWATENNVFSGYQNGTFGTQNYINRAEFLKVLLESFNVQMFGQDGTNGGFKDLSPYQWYMPYVLTAKFYGIVEGYEDGTARLNNNINRAEMLKIVVETYSKFNHGKLSTNAALGGGYMDVPANAWYKQYADVNYNYELLDENYNYNGYMLNPSALVTRGEVALLLHRMNNYGLLPGYTYHY